MHSSGTTAITSGIVSLLKAHYPTWSNDQIVNQIFSTAINVEEYNQTNSCNFDFTGLIGHGLLDAEYALTFDGTIDRDLIWNKELKLYHNIVVEAGKTLTIRDGTNLMFEAGKTFNVYGNLIIEGNLTINQSINILNGGSLQILPGATITFTNNSSIVVNGVLNAVGTSSNKITFTSQSGTTHSSWGSITFDGPGASGSILEYVNVQYGTRVEAINTSNITIRNCRITDTYDGIRFYASSGSIRNNVVSTNSIGHGIIIEQSSTATCEQNVLTKTSSPRTGVGILYRGGASGTIWQNDINGWDWGIGAIWGSSPDFRPNPLVPQNRNNRVTNCRIGVEVYNNSWPIVGLAATGFGYNSIYTNEYKNVYFTSGGTLYALQNYWGGRPTSSMFYLGPDCIINTDAWLKKNPWQLYSDLEISSTTKNEDEESLLNRTVNDPSLIIESMSEGIKLRIEEKFADAKDFFISYISQYPEKQAAYVELYKCYAGETENDLINYFSSLPDKTSNEQKMLLSYMYLKQNEIELAKTINDEIISENPDTKLEAEAKINNVYISLYNENNFDAAVAIFNEVLQKPNLSTDLELSLVQQSIESYARLHSLTTPVFNLPKENLLNNASPDNYSLFVNYPNPFNPSTKISYSLKESGFVSLKVYDILGNEITKLVNTTQQAGNHSVEFNATDLPSGVYIYTLQVNGFTNSKKMLLLK